MSHILDVLVGVAFLMVVAGMISIPFFIIHEERKEVRLCADYLGQEFRWYDGIGTVNFSAKFAGPGKLACCYQEYRLVNGTLSSENCIGIINSTAEVQGK